MGPLTITFDLSTERQTEKQWDDFYDLVATFTRYINYDSYEYSQTWTVIAKNKANYDLLIKRLARMKARVTIYK